MKFKIGDKVVPHSKSEMGPLEDCMYWEKARNEGQNFLYVVGYEDDFECYTLNYDPNDMDGNYYTELDLTLYEDRSDKDFSIEQLPTYNWSELNGKVLEIIHREDDTISALYGYEKETKKFYVISESIKR